MSHQQLCFVLMPFGSKPDPAGGPDIDFDRVYHAAVKPGIEDANLLPIRADEEKLGGIIHKAMFERLLVCDYAVADLTTSNPNVMYELGVRHAARPRTTLTLYAESSPLPFDVRLLHSQRYRLGPRNEFTDEHAAALRRAVHEHLLALASVARADDTRDSPLFQLLTGWNPAPLRRDAAESFEDHVRTNEEVKGRLKLISAASHDADRRARAQTELAELDSEILDPGPVDVDVLTELMLTHRTLRDWTGMIAVYQAMPAGLRQQVPIRQQVAFAHNRRAESTGSGEDRAEAQRLLEELELEQGSSAETSGLLGRIYKSQWWEARAAGEGAKAALFLTRAVRAYRRGFESDWREIYPGINAVTLLDVQGSPRALEQRNRLLPVVRFAAEQRLRSARADYWDHATLLEIAVLDNDEEKAAATVEDVLATLAEPWQAETTAGNLRIIQATRAEQHRDVEWLEGVITMLDAAAGTAPPPR